MVVGEMVPKNIAIAAPGRTLLPLRLPNRAYVAVFGPVMRVLTAFSNRCVRLFGVEPRDELATATSAQELAMMLTASREEGLIEDAAHQLLSGALDMVDRRITTVAVPRDRVVWLPSTAPPAAAEALVVSSGHSRLVVVGDGLDDVLGFIHAKDLPPVPSSAPPPPQPLARTRQRPAPSG